MSAPEKCLALECPSLVIGERLFCAGCWEKFTQIQKNVIFNAWYYGELDLPALRALSRGETIKQWNER